MEKKLSEGFDDDEVIAEFNQRYTEVDEVAEAQNCKIEYAKPPKQQKPKTVGLRRV